jgi:hypothetical protein
VPVGRGAAGVAADAQRGLPGEGQPQGPEQARRALGLLLARLAERLEPALRGALEQAAVAWDRFDEVAVLDPALRRDAARLTSAARELEGAQDPALQAAGLELRIALGAALGLVDLVERRLAVLVRLRVQSGDPLLLPEGRPFLDLASALAEAAKGWA